MLYSIKELIVVLFFGYLIFRFSRSLTLTFCAENDFLVRRNAWFLLTAAGFLCPSFWLFTLIAIPILIVAGRKDSNPAAMYLLLLHVVPPIVLPVPMIGISYLFNVDIYFLLSICVLLPVARRIRKSKFDRAGVGIFVTTDYLLLTYGILTAILFVHTQSASGFIYPTTFTDCLRRAFVFFFSIFVPFYSISRSGTNKKAIVEMLAMYALGCALMTAVAIFEGVRHWLVFAEFGARWGVPFSSTNYITRGDALRAMASSGHPLSLGFLLAIAFGCWLYLGSRVKSLLLRTSITIFWWLGLIAAYSRGPWFGGICIVFAFMALRPGAAKNIVRGASVFFLFALGLTLSPLREKIVNVIPFFGGTVDTFNVTYRQRLLARCWEIIQDNPLLGDQFALLRMQDLRQGEGIIDIINTYVQVLLDNGFVGLTLFLSFILICLFKAWRTSRRSRLMDPDFSLLGCSITACILGLLLMLADASFEAGPERIFYALAGVATAYAHVDRLQLLITRRADSA